MKEQTSVGAYFESWVNLLDLLFESKKLQESFRIYNEIYSWDLPP